MDEHGRRISRRTFAQMTGAAAVSLAVAPATASAHGSRPAWHGPSTLADGDPRSVGMDPDRLEDAFARVARRATDGRYPGAVALVARHGVIVGERAFGVRLAGSTDATTTDTL
jgi:hypothetical protein